MRTREAFTSSYKRMWGASRPSSVKLSRSRRRPAPPELSRTCARRGGIHGALPAHVGMEVRFAA
eukprot:5052743-Pyramimonas_sp.AAC.1